MTTPVSSSNSSVYDPSAQMCFADAGQPAAATPAVALAPVVIEGDAGAQQLLERYDQTRQAADCSLEAKEAALSCAKAGVAAVAGGLSATTVVAALPAAAVVLVESISCGKDLAAYFECEGT